MPRNNTSDDQQNDEDPDEVGKPHGDIEENEERVPQKSSVHKNEEERDDEDDDDAEDLDLDDLSAMEGPDA